jgi:2-polyprenyl-3-methyl-5-hydroxy-6-metoxy-1,4-benzoquinol methylase
VQQEGEHTTPYHIEEIEKLDRNNSHKIILDFIEDSNLVLDVGCSTGFLGKYLKSLNIRAVGVEIDPLAAEIANPYYEKMIVGDVTSPEVLNQLEENSFQTIVLGDIIEHLNDPWRFVKEISTKLADSGNLIISIPNLGHSSVIASLLSGTFQYRKEGLLDRTHYRFFGIQSLLSLVIDAGLTPEELKRVTYDVFSTEIPVEIGKLPAGLFLILDRCLETHTYQFVIKAGKSTPKEDFSVYMERFSLPPPQSSDQEEELGKYLKDLEKKRKELREAREYISTCIATITEKEHIIEDVASDRASLQRKLEEKEEAMKKLRLALDCEKSEKEKLYNQHSIQEEQKNEFIVSRVTFKIESRLQDIQSKLRGIGTYSAQSFFWDCAYDILIPIYNAFDHAKRCIESVLKNTATNHKIYLLDDASTDPRIFPLLKSFEIKDSRVHVILAESNMGFVSNVNRGFNISQNTVVSQRCKWGIS